MRSCDGYRQTADPYGAWHQTRGPAGAGDGGVGRQDLVVDWLVQDPRSLPAGEDVQVSIVVVDPDGNMLDQLEESRRVPDGKNECTCAVLIYQWNADGRVGRFS